MNLKSRHFKRAITEHEHLRIIEREAIAAKRNQGSRNGDGPHYDERRDFYELLWHTGASQGDAAILNAEDINWKQRTISYARQKLENRQTVNLRPALVRFGKEVAGLLKRRPATGPLFPYLRTVRPGDRATEFKGRNPPLIPVCLGRTRPQVRLPGALRSAGPWAQLQSRALCLRQKRRSS